MAASSRTTRSPGAGRGRPPRPGFVVRHSTVGSTVRKEPGLDVAAGGQVALGVASLGSTLPVSGVVGTRNAQTALGEAQVTHRGYAPDADFSSPAQPAPTLAHWHPYGGDLVIHLVDQALEHFLRDAVPLPADEIDVSFQAPDRRWGAGVTRPTVNLFLWDIRRATHKARAGWATYEEDGKIYRNIPPRWVELSYLATAWATQERDEHQLLGSVLGIVLTHRSIPHEMVPEALTAITAKVGLGLATNAEQKPQEFWSALDGQLKPGLQLKISMSVPMGEPVEAPAAPTERDVGLADRTAPDGDGATSRIVEDESEGTTRRRRGRSELEEGLGQSSGAH